ncbi:hypothetical protein, partial [Clostridium perfringens]
MAPRELEDRCDAGTGAEQSRLLRAGEGGPGGFEVIGIDDLGVTHHESRIDRSFTPSTGWRKGVDVVPAQGWVAEEAM